MKNLNNKVVAITGASSGIGRAMAIAFAKEGAHLALSDINPEGLEETAKLITNPAVNVTQHIVDVANRDAMEAYARDVVEQHGRVHIIVNNAGVAVINNTIENTAVNDLEWMVGINFWGVVHGTQVFLPHIRKENEGHVVIVSSVGGFSSGAKLGYYCATKFAVRAIVEALYTELRDTNIGVTGIHPGGTATNMPANAKSSNTSQEELDELNRKVAPMLITPPEEVARKTIEGIKRNRLRVITGRDAKLLYYATRFFPMTLLKLARSGRLVDV